MQYTWNKVISVDIKIHHNVVLVNLCVKRMPSVCQRFQSMRKFQFKAFNVILMVHALSLLSLFVILSLIWMKLPEASNLPLERKLLKICLRKKN